MKETDAAYIAGLFDGEGHVIYKQYPKQRKGQKKAYPTWKIRNHQVKNKWVDACNGDGVVVREKHTRYVA
jgi:hypothetical protein